MRLGISLAAVLALMGGLAVPSGAAIGGDNRPPAGNSGPAPSDGSTSGSSGQAKQTNVRSCSLYATSSNFGLSCLTGEGTGGRTVQQVLGYTHKVPNRPPTCWDTLISPQDLESKYHIPPLAGELYYVHSCISGLILHNPLSYQPTVQLNQDVIEIPVNTPNCDTKKPYLVEQKGKCIMTLIQNQQQVVNATGHKDGKIPGIVLSQQPSTNVRTNEDVAYVDAAADDHGHRITTTRKYTIGGISLFATMNPFTIYPHGPDGVSKQCNGTAEVTPEDSRASRPDACWWKYDRSSADQPNKAYQFRAQATWTVYYQVDNGPLQKLQTFQKYDDLTIPVSDIQSIVVH